MKRKSCLKAAFLVAVVFFLAFCFLVYVGSRMSSGGQRRVSSANNLKQLGIVFLMYANESEGGLYPRFAEHLPFAFDIASAVPEYLSQTTVLINPDTAEAEALRVSQEKDACAPWITRHYLYLGYAAPRISEFRLLCKSIQSGALPDGDITGEGMTLRRLRSGVETFFENDSQLMEEARARSARYPRTGSDHPADSIIPAMLERPCGRDKDSINVLYLDGHVELLSLGTYPNTKEFWQEVAKVDPTLTALPPTPGKTYGCSR